MKIKALEDRRRALEESFFKDQNAKLLAAMRKKACPGREESSAEREFRSDES